MFKIQKLFSYLILVTLLAGCATKRESFEINKDVFKKPGTVVIMQTSGLEEPQFLKGGDQGLIDLAVNSVITSSVSDKVKTIDTKPVMNTHYYQAYNDFLAGHSFKVIKDTTPLKKEDLAKPHIDDAQHAPYDFRSLKAAHNANYALILEPRAFGAIRPYYSIIPTGAPRGYANLAVYMVNLEDNSLMGYYTVEMGAPVQGEWDTPPEYNGLIAASKNALVKALSKAHDYLFL